jgi:arylsulfatase A-like enzyme
MAGVSTYRPRIQDTDLEDLPAEARRLATPGAADFELTRQTGRWEEAVSAYRASIRYADDLFGRVLRALDSGPNGSNTIVAFWSDNGFHLGEKHRFHKSTLWERSCRVPLVIAVPWIKPGVTNAPVSLLDLYPTLAALCGLPIPQAVDGQDLSLQLANPTRKSNRVVLTNFRPGNYAVSDGRWRYLRYHDGGEELYDLTQDPHEWNNLAREPRHRNRLARMARHVPTVEAQPAPPKNAYRFHQGSYTWEPAGVPRQ